MARIKRQRKYSKLFGEHIRKLRTEKFPDDTVSQFAEDVGITGPYLSNIELGNFPPPDESVVKALAEKLSEDADFLLALAGYVDTELIKGLSTSKTKAMAIPKALRMVRAIQGGKNEHLVEQIIAYLIGVSLEEKRMLNSTESFFEMLTVASRISEGGGEPPDDIKSTIDRGLKVLGPLMEQLEVQGESQEP